MRSRITSWVLNQEDEWEVVENEAKVPGIGVFIGNTEVPSTHSFIFDKMQDALITVFTKIEMEEEEHAIQQKELPLEEEKESEEEDSGTGT
jgi:hypothetical protein